MTGGPSTACPIMACRRRFRSVNVVDAYTRACVLQAVDCSLLGHRLANELDRLAQSRTLPKTLVCDHGPALTGKALCSWSRRTRVKLHFIQPGKPTQHAFIERFNGQFREDCLDLHWFIGLDDARSTIERWRIHYNEVRPHRSLGRKPPALFARAVT